MKKIRQKRTVTVPTVSVIMAVRNQERYLPESINSILHQTFQDFEIVIVDDASNTVTQRILKKYQQRDGRIRIFRNDRQLGLTKSLKRAVAAARGHFIARQDGDDISFKNRLQKQVRFLRTHSHVALVGISYILWYTRNNKREHLILKESHHDIVTVLHKPASAMTMIMARAKVLRALGGYSASMYYAQDYELYLRASRRHQLANIPDILGIVRSHGRNNSIRFKPKMKAAVEWAFLGEVKKKPFGKFLREWLQRKKNRDLVERYFEQHNYSAVVALYERRIRKYGFVPVDILYRIASAAKKINHSKLAYSIFLRILSMKYIDKSFIGGSHFHLGELYLAERATQQARLHFKHCLEALPTHARAHAYVHRRVTNPPVSLRSHEVAEAISH